jgi:DNA-binding LytR/AlgR family response regulator
MNEIEGILPAGQFMRVHKSYVVAIGHIKSIYGNSVDTGKITLPIGLNYKEKVMNLVGKK